MKKILTLLVASMATVLVVGCSNSSSSSSNNNGDYKTDMSKGDKAVNKKDYLKALTYYTSANEAKNTKASSAAKKQAKNLSNAKKSMNKRQFSDAKKSIIKARDQKNGKAKMTSQAKTLLSKVKEIQRNRSDFKANIKTAKSLIKSNNIDQATTLLKQVTSFKDIKAKYYSDIYKQAKKLLDNMPKATSTNNKTDSTNNNSSNSTDTNNNQTTDSNSNSTDTTDGSNPAANGDFDIESKEYDGKTITDADIANARQQLKDQGVKTVGAWSDGDIIRAIKNAAKDGRTTIQPSDAKVGD